MNTLKKIIVIATFLITCALIAPCTHVYASSATSEIITESETDVNPIPDKFNTGAKEPAGGFQTVGLGGAFKCTQDGKDATLAFLISGGDTNVFNLAYGSRDMYGTYVIKNTDFSSYPVKIFHEDIWNNNATITGQKMKFVFENCKFKTFSCGKYECQNISYEFTDCSFENLNGSNLTATRCYFGGGTGDRINLFTYTYINYCYFANPTYYGATDHLVHLDGVQIYGDNTNHIDIHDIYFDHCRFEIPTCKYPNAPNIAVNACIMLQLEYSNGYNMGFTNCILNGGGYTVYAHAKNDAFTLTNVNFENITVGGGRCWGQIYPHQASTINFNFNTWKETDSLYVSSVWQSQKSTSISITNDTRQERSFIIYTSSGKSYKYTIQACPHGKQMVNYLFEDLPFDVVYTIPEKAKWLVVYEEKTNMQTGEKTLERIRFKNFGNSEKTALLSFQKTNKICFEFESIPDKTKFTKVSAKKKSIYIKWKKLSSNVDGYEIQFSTSKKFKKNVITVCKSTKKNNSYKRSNLKRKKNYYVRIRAYKEISKYGKTEKIYSDWSKVKHIKTK